MSRLLAHVDYLDEAVDELTDAIATQLAPFAPAVQRLDTIPGVNHRTAQVLIAELGPDMGVFTTAGHAAKWAGLCPGDNESAGKHKSGQTPRGNRCSGPR